MHLRRALLLFAIVLGLAALATSVSRPSRESSSRERSAAPGQARAVPQDAPSSGNELRLPAKRPLIVRTDQAVTLQVPVTEPGQVELVGLGLTSPADRLTPARFELLITKPGVHRVRFTPAGDEPGRYLGRLVAR